MAAERLFRAMGSDAHLVVVGGRPGLLDLAHERIERLERLWSRFRPDSEVSELNRRAGTPVRVSCETVELVRRATDGWWLSGGAFDPTVLGPLLRAGYDRSFEALGAAPPASVSPLEIGASDIEVDGDEVRLPPGVGFDPGGIGKGLAADMVVAELLDAGAEGICVNLGGDVAVAGVGPDGDGWTIAVEHEWSGDPVALLGLGRGAVATSTTLRRRWRHGAGARHHLIDPRTGEPSDSDLNHASVVAATAWAAEVLAKAVLLRARSTPSTSSAAPGPRRSPWPRPARCARRPGSGPTSAPPTCRAPSPRPPPVVASGRRRRPSPGGRATAGSRRRWS